MRPQLPCLAAFAILALAGCKRQDMAAQGRSRAYDRSDFFADGSSMRPPVPGTVARNRPDVPVPQPKVIDAALLARGQERFAINCVPCHGRVGDGQGMIVQRGFPRPPSFHIERLRKAPASHFFDVITHGHGVMYSYAARVPPRDRWAIIAYIRALQVSQSVEVAGLPPDDRAKLLEVP